MSSRRDVLKGLGAAAVATPVVGGAAAVRAGSEPGPPPSDAAQLAEPDAAPWALLAPYAAGATVGEHVLTGLTSVAHGAFVIELGEARVHVCAHAGDPRGLASTDRFDLLLMNGGDGATDSEESLARTIAVLAAVLDANTDAALAAHPELAGLLTHPERLAAFDRADCDALA